MQIDKAKPCCTTEVLIKHKLPPQEYRTCGTNENPRKSLGCPYWELCKWRTRPHNLGVRQLKAVSGNVRDVVMACFEAVPRLIEMENNPEGTIYDIIGQEGDDIEIMGTKPTPVEGGILHEETMWPVKIPAYPRLGEAQGLGQESRRKAREDAIRKQRMENAKNKRLGIIDDIEEKVVEAKPK